MPEHVPFGYWRSSEFRSPQTWREAHEAFVFLQGTTEDSKCLVAATAPRDEEGFTSVESKREKKRKQKEAEKASAGGALVEQTQAPPEVAAIRLPEHLRRVCFRAAALGTMMALA